MIIANRASTILYQFLRNIPYKKDQFFIIPSNICVEVLFTVIKAEIAFKFIDVNDELTDLDLNSINYKDEKIIGLLYNHLYGNEYTPVSKFIQIKKNNPNFKIIDDRCLCRPQLNYKLNSFIDLVLFSTGPKKQVDVGKYGFAYCKDSDFYLNYSKSPTSPTILNSAMQLLKNSISYNKIDYLKGLLMGNWLDEQKPDISAEKYKMIIRNADEQQSMLKQKLQEIYMAEIPRVMQYSSEFQNWRFNIMCSNSLIVTENLFKENLFASNHYFPLSNYFSLPTKNADWIYTHTVNLFIDRYFSEEKALKTARIIKRIAKTM